MEHEAGAAARDDDSGRIAAPFSAMDFRHAKDVFSLLKLETGGQTYPAALKLQGLTLLNLPYAKAGAGPAGGEGGSLRALSALLWVARTPEARTMDMQPIYIVEGVTVATTCTEVHFLRSFLQRLRKNSGRGSRPLWSSRCGASASLHVLPAPPAARGVRLRLPAASSVFPVRAPHVPSRGVCPCHRQHPRRCCACGACSH